MTDDRLPRDDAFEVVDLDALTDGVHASSEQWSAISSTAAHRRRRRAWALSAAALVVILVGTAAVLASRTGDGGVDIAAGGVAGDVYVLPPADATEVAAATVVQGSVILYTDTDGRAWALRQGLPLALAGGGTGDPVTTTLGGPPPFDVAPVGKVTLVCSGYAVSGTSSALDGFTGTTTVEGFGPATAYFQVGTGAAYLGPSAGGDGGCDTDDPVVAAVGRLRLVDRATYDEYLSKIATTIPTSDGETLTPSTGVMAPPSTTTIPEDPPADRASAEQQIAAAVAGFSTQAPDGSYPNLEDGVAKAAEYQERFATAARQSGADTVSDADGDTSAVSRIHFESPERASITIEFTSTLPSGTFTFGQEGEAIVQDGRWVVTYDTVLRTFARACIPPGGYDGCPSSSGPAGGTSAVLSSSGTIPPPS